MPKQNALYFSMHVSWIGSISRWIPTWRATCNQMVFGEIKSFQKMYRGRVIEDVCLFFSTVCNRPHLNVSFFAIHLVRRVCYPSVSSWKRQNEPIHLHSKHVFFITMSKQWTQLTYKKVKRLYFLGESVQHTVKKKIDRSDGCWHQCRYTSTYTIHTIPSSQWLKKTWALKWNEAYLEFIFFEHTHVSNVSKNHKFIIDHVNYLKLDNVWLQNRKIVRIAIARMCHLDGEHKWAHVIIFGSIVNTYCQPHES